MPVNICLKHHESLSENGVLMHEHTDTPLIWEEVGEDIIQCAQQKIARAGGDHSNIPSSPYLPISQTY